MLGVTFVTSSLHARTWTSSDGSKTFQGEYASQEDGFVTVKRGQKKLRFKIELLSTADQEWLKLRKETDANGDRAEASEKEANANTDSLGKIGDKINKCLSKFDGTKYSSTELDNTPKYYLLYFSASW